MVLKMSKRRSNVLTALGEKSNLNGGSCNSDSEYESDTYSPVNKKRCNYGKTVNDRRMQTTENLSNEVLPKENNEHTYSCTPLFTNITNSENGNSSEYSCDSDDINEKYNSGRRISEKSTSSESISKSGIGKSVSWSGSSRNAKPSRRAGCSSKNAIMARMNRQRKKEYVANLEGNVQSLKAINKELKTKLNDQQESINLLKNEIKYLKSVLSNSKEIGILLRRLCVGNNKELKLTSSILSTPSSFGEEIISSDECKKDENDLDWSLSPSFVGTSEMDNIFQCDSPPTDLAAFESANNNYGVCLHVANNQVSFEFCASCSRSASDTLNNDMYTSVK